MRISDVKLRELRERMEKERKELHEFYVTQLNIFTDATEKAIISSHAATGIDAGPRRYWASVLFIKLCTTSVSILWLCPQSQLNQDGTHWDFASIATLARNLFECALQFFYFAIEPISDEEWKARLTVMQLHDCMERSRMFQAFDPNHSDLTGFAKQAEELREILQKNTYFRALPEKLQKNLLKGVRSSILTQDEILTKMGQTTTTIRGYYRFLSSQSHPFPLGFYRTGEHNRGRGEDNRVDKGYIAHALEFCADTLKRSTDDFQKTFADIVSFSTRTFDWRVLKKADVNS
jgi:hypothetical protein